MTFPSAIFSDRIIPWLFAGALTLGAGLLLAAGPAPQLIYPSDCTAYLDACHRASLGQWLARDFTYPIGPVGLLPIVVAMKLGGANVNALVHGAVLAWLAGGILAWGTVRSRMPAWLAAGFALFVAATAAAPYTLDFGSWQVLSYGMLYNRLAWAALAVAAAAALLPRIDGRTPSFVPAGLGACTIWLWALKPNYLLILLPLVIYHWISAPAPGSWFGRAVGGAAGTLLVVWLSVRFSPLDYIRMHLAMAESARQGTAATYGPGRELRENFLLVFVLAATWTLVLRGGGGGLQRGRLRFTLLALAGCILAANLTNNQFSEIPLWGALGWLAAAWPATGGAARFARFAGLACGLAFTWQPVASIAYNFAWKHYRAPGAPPAVEVSSPTWQGMPMRPVPGEPATAEGNLESAANYAVWLNDGLALLARVHPPHGTVLCLDWTNPFPFATQTLPAAGDEVAWHVGRYIGPSNHPDVARLMAGAAVVMEPRRSIQPDSLAFKRTLFAPALERSFVVAAETDQWRLWLRRDAAGRLN